MTLHEVTRLIKHKLKAKGRHGTHSPFVYAFIEDLMVPAKISGTLIDNIASYFGITSVFYLGTRQGNINGSLYPVFTTGCKLRFDRLLVLDGNSENFSSPANDCLSQALPGDIVLVYPLHKTSKQSEQWQSLVERAEVKLSMDVFDLGLLFFRGEFKVKQHFLLKFQ